MDIKEKQRIPEFRVGDTIRVITKLYEQDKIRFHPFEGVVMAIKAKSFTVRRVSFGEGIERVFLIDSPNIETIEVIKRAKVRRAKLYYLRGKL
jgi:large subunit ribosomal protein L19